MVGVRRSSFLALCPFPTDQQSGAPLPHHCTSTHYMTPHTEPTHPPVLDHQPGEEHAPERGALCAHAAGGGVHQLLHGLQDSTRQYTEWVGTGRYQRMEETAGRGGGAAHSGVNPYLLHEDRTVLKGQGREAVLGGTLLPGCRVETLPGVMHSPPTLARHTCRSISGVRTGAGE